MEERMSETVEREGFTAESFGQLALRSPCHSVPCEITKAGCTFKCPTCEKVYRLDLTSTVSKRMQNVRRTTFTLIPVRS